MVSVSSKNGTTSPKRKNTKSRNGCLTCKKKRLKCDETKPECLNCQKKKIKCGGYATNFKWRSFNDAGGDLFMSSEQNPIPLANEKKKRKTSSSCSLDLENRSLSQDEIFRKQSELASLSVTGKSIKEIEFQNNLIAKGINPNTYEKLHLKTEITPNSANESFNLAPHDKTKRSSSFPESITSPGERRSPFNRRYSTSSRSGILSEDINTSRIDYLAAAADAVRNSGLKKSPIPSFGVDGLSPDSVAILNKNTPISEGEGSIGLVHNSSELAQELNLTPSLSALINFAFTSDETKGKDDINLDFPLSPFNLNDSASHIPSATSDTDLSIVDGIETEFSYDQLPLVRQDQSPQNAQSPPLMFSSNKSLMLTSEHEQLLHLYSRYTCAIMSIKNGPNENPWRNLILPVAYKYPCLMNSVISMTLFHLAGHNSNKTASPYLRARGYAYMKKSLLELATDLSKTRKKDGDQQEVPADIALTTCLNLAVIESWDTHISSGIAHLKGAKSMIQKVLDLLKTLQQDIKKKKRELGKAPGDSRELTALVLEKKKSLQKKLAFVTDLEWERMLDVQCMEVQQESNDTLYLKYDSNHESNNGGIIAIPESLQYLFNVWIYFEVLAQMTTRATQDDKGIDLVATITTIAQKSRDKKLEFNSKLKTLASGYSDKGSESSPSTGSLSSEKSMSWNGDKFDFFQDFETVRCNNTYVDPLLGCAQSLFSIMGAVATLVSKIRRRNQEHENKGSSRFARNSLATITAASQLKHHLTEWSPTITASMIASSMKEESSKKASWDISSCIATAEAYRYATLLYLHHAVPEIPSIPSYEIAEKIFILLASIPASSDLHVVHIFPLLVSSCEAQPGEQREWCNSRWSILIDKLWIGNVDRSYEVVKEVWRRKDEHMEKYGNEKYGEKGEEGDPGRRICSQISGLMAAISRDKVDPHDDAYGGINSKFHWSSVMREWGWEVLLA